MKRTNEDVVANVGGVANLLEAVAGNVDGGAIANVNIVANLDLIHVA